MDEVGVRLPVLAKLEKPQAVERLDDVVAAFDGVMVARGDLGVEMPLERVPLVQKRAVQAARELAKPVIVATQMLDSMVGAPRPTRAEASDVANAVLDGADALMLSGETSVGRYPVESVATMARARTFTSALGVRAAPISAISAPCRWCGSNACTNAASAALKAADTAAVAAGLGGAACSGAVPQPPSSTSTETSPPAWGEGGVGVAPEGGVEVMGTRIVPSRPERDG